MNRNGCWHGSVHVFLEGNFWLNDFWISVHACGSWLWIHNLEYIWPIGLQLIQSKIEEFSLIALGQFEIVGENKVPW